MAINDTPYVKGVDKLKRRIATIRQSLALPPLVEEISDLLQARTLRRFDRQVDPDEKAWKPLSPATLADKKRKGYERQPALKRSGKMRDSIKVIRGGVGSLAANTGASARIGIQEQEVAKYARAQNFGSKTIPARRFLGVGALDVKAVDSLLRRKAAKLGLTNAAA